MQIVSMKCESNDIKKNYRNLTKGFYRGKSKQSNKAKRKHLAK